MYLFVFLLPTQEAKEVTAALNAFTPPSTHELVLKAARATSEIWRYGVKLKKLRDGKFSFACFGNPVCRENSRKGIFIGVSKGSTSNALGHVTAMHQASE